MIVDDQLILGAVLEHLDKIDPPSLIGCYVYIAEHESVLTPAKIVAYFDGPFDDFDSIMTKLVPENPYAYMITLDQAESFRIMQEITAVRGMLEMDPTIVGLTGPVVSSSGSSVVE